MTRLEDDAPSRDPIGFGEWLSRASSIEPASTSHEELSLGFPSKASFDAALDTQSLSILNSHFGIPGSLSFQRGPGDFVFGRIQTPSSTAEICLHGAHVTAFAPTGQAPVIWLSPDAVFAPGKAIRGGVPICWPWFADHPDDATQPAHGVARTSCWEVLESTLLDDGSVRIDFSLPSKFSEPLAPGIELRLTVTVSSQLDFQLITANQSEKRFSMTEALHTYLHVGEIEKVRIRGLDGVEYLDKVEASGRKRQEGDVIVTSETDRIYGDTTADVLVHDEELARVIRVAKKGSAATVVWNPWAEVAARMTDFTDDGFRKMVCVEAANAAGNTLVIEPGSRHILGTTLSVE